MDSTLWHQRFVRGLSSLVLGCAFGPLAFSDTGAQTSDYPHGDFRADCQMCHLPDSWSPARIDEAFDHSQFGFSLEGAHRGAPCLLCHLSLSFDETTGGTCSACHQDVHLGELGPACENCHSTKSFADRAFELRSHRMTRFPLTGVHVSVECTSCHLASGGRFVSYVNTPTECASCHLAEFQAASNPPHAGFSSDCTACHSTFGWGGGDFDHALTAFPLTGGHREVACERCHADNQFAGVDVACYSCHQEDYTGTTDPSHSTAGFGTDCSSCHTTVSWTGAGFDHSLTSFPLTGAHRDAACQRCHVGSQYAGTPTDCYACHEADYSGTQSPDHLAAGFGTNCAECHSTSGWQGASFDHDTFFPLRGAHSVSCASCHTEPASYAVFDCLGCHEHDQPTMDSKHHEVTGYSYDSAACYRCHSRAGL